MAKKLMIFGGSGFVGGNLAKLAQTKDWKVWIVDSFYRAGLEDVEWKLTDITKKEDVDRVFEEIKPDAVVNVAAVADIDKAEREKDLAWRVNVDGARFVADNCAKYGIKYIFFSSDAVFDGKGKLYGEEDPVGPVNYYGRTKAEAEKAVLTVYPGAIVVRISLVIGFPVTGGNSFFGGLEPKLKEGREVLCSTTEYRTPVDVSTLSQCVLELAESDFSGVLHLGSTNSLNRYELTKKAARTMGYDENLVKPESTPKDTPGRAPRHQNGIIATAKAQQILKTKLLSVDESINRAITER